MRVAVEFRRESAAAAVVLLCKQKTRKKRNKCEKMNICDKSVNPAHRKTHSESPIFFISLSLSTVCFLESMNGPCVQIPSAFVS